MPEGDTLYRTARALDKALTGKTVTAFETAYAKLASVDDQTPVVGRVVEKVEAKGKWCLIYFSGDLILTSHMLMSGSWHIYRTGEKWWKGRSHMRVVVTCGDMQGVLFDAQIAEFHTAKSLERSTQIPKLGPDVLSEDFSVETGIAALQQAKRERPEAEVGVTLLNQRVMAGLGNVYKSEVAFAAAVNPFRQMSTVTDREMQVMAEMSQRWMRANVANGSNARGESGDGIVTYTGPRRTTHAMDRSDRTWVYGRQGHECRRCGALVERRLQGEQARPTYWCPGCQPWIAADGQSAAEPVGRKVKILGHTRRRGSC